MLFNKKKPEEPVTEIIEEPQAPEQPEQPEQEQQPASAARDYSPSDTTYIGKGITFYGNFVTADDMEINGAVEGDLRSSAKLVVTDGAAYKGNATVDSLDLSGSIYGSVDCNQLARLTEHANMTGTLHTRFLQTFPGSYFEGDMSMGAFAAPAEEKPASESEDIEVTEDNIFEN